MAINDARAVLCLAALCAGAVAAGTGLGGQYLVDGGALRPVVSCALFGSKGGLANITRNAAQALRSQRIRVNGINCGWMDTPGEDDTQRRFHGARDGWLAAAEAPQPMGMLVKPDHVPGWSAICFHQRRVS